MLSRVLLTTLLSTFVTSLLLCVATAGESKPHVVLIVADDLGWNDVSWHNDKALSPNLEQLARDGILLNRSYVQPICSPTRSALMASRYPFTIGRQQNVIWPLCPTGLTLDADLLPENLQQLGYDTHAIGKWHLGFCKWEYTPTLRGFDSFTGFYTGSEDYYKHKRYQSYIVDGEEIRTEGYDMRRNTSVDWDATDHYSAFVFSKAAQDLLTKRDPSVPMFLYLPFQSVHSPYQVPSKYYDMYPNIENENRRTHLAMVTALDEAIGDIVSTLKETGHYNNSIIIFTTDNGGATIGDAGNNWPLRGNKTTLWEGGTRGAAFVHSPLLDTSLKGTTHNGIVHVTDWYPTLVELAGGTSPSDIDGVSQWEALTNASAPAAREYFVYDIDNTDGMRAAIRQGPYKLVVGDVGPGEWTPPPEGNFKSKSSCSGHAKTTNLQYAEEIRLYNVEDDPEERNDISQSESAKVAEMMALINKEMKRYTPIDQPPDEPKADPKNFNGTWAPGWC